MLLFKDLKNNCPVYILDKQDMSITQGVATSVGFPRMPMSYKPGQNTMVVDVTITADGKTATYEIPENLSVTYANNFVLATDKAGLVSDIEAIKNTADQIIKSYDSQKERYDKACALLMDVKPEYKEKKETENRLNKMESSITRMEGMMEKLIESLGGK